MFQQNLEAKLPNPYPPSIKEHWDQMKLAITTTCEETLGLKKKRHQDWFDDNNEQLQQLIDEKLREKYLSPCKMTSNQLQRGHNIVYAKR